MPERTSLGHRFAKADMNAMAELLLELPLMRYAMTHRRYLMMLCLTLLGACKKDDPAPPTAAPDGLFNNGWTRLAHSASNTQMGWGPTAPWCVRNSSNGGLTPATWYEAVFMSTANMGSTWSPIDTISGDLGSEEFRLFGRPTFIDDQIGFSTLSHGTVFNITSTVHKTVDGGQTWSAVGWDGGSFVRVGATSRVFRFGADETYVSQNMSGSWAVVTPSIGLINDMVFVDDLHGFATGDAGILASVDGGANWQTLVGQEFTWISHQDASTGVAALRFSTTPDAVLRTTNGWANSEQVVTPEELVAPGSICLDATGRLYVSKEERLYLSMDLGATWALDLELPADHNIVWVRRIADHVVVATSGQSWARKHIPL